MLHMAAVREDTGVKRLVVLYFRQDRVLESTQTRPTNVWSVRVCGSLLPQNLQQQQKAICCRARPFADDEIKH